MILNKAGRYVPDQKRIKAFKAEFRKEFEREAKLFQGTHATPVESPQPQANVAFQVNAIRDSLREQHGNSL